MAEMPAGRDIFLQIKKEIPTAVLYPEKETAGAKMYKPDAVVL